MMILEIIDSVDLDGEWLLKIALWKLTARVVIAIAQRVNSVMKAYPVHNVT
jgi:hypothetical protein